MFPTLKNGDFALVFRAQNIKRYDLVVFKVKNKLYIKRIIGLPLENVLLSSDGVFINQQQLIENYLTPSSKNYSGREFNDVIPKDSYFVMGDNRKSSVDSRSLGMIKKEEIILKVFTGF